MRVALLAFASLWLGLSDVKACRLALALALDVSGSVDEVEYGLQMHGLAAALEDSDVTAALFAMPGAPVSVAVYEWSSSDYQRVIQSWVAITDQTVLGNLVAKLRSWERTPAPEPTGIGAALTYGKDLIEQGPPCWSATLDVSGDGKNNDWPTPHELKQNGTLGALRINALVVLLRKETGSQSDTREAGELPAYFQARVIQGPDAFVEVALGYDDYARAMRRKLLRELATQPIGMRVEPGERGQTALKTQ